MLDSNSLYVYDEDGNEVDPSQTTTETTTEDSGSSDVEKDDHPIHFRQ